MKTVTILGITGSIGKTAIRGIREFQDRIRVVAASCNSNVDAAIRICKENSISNLCITSETNDRTVDGIKIYSSLEKMLNEVHADMVLNGIAGSPGLLASFSAMQAKSDLALANKESVVLGGQLLFDHAKRNGVSIIPVDSEHSAIDELICDCGKDNVDRLVITASGGPFRDRPLEELDQITPEMAANHPTWNMGPKISIDSSTLANKGLEVIEAHYLFNFDANSIEVVIHPQSVVHSMVSIGAYDREGRVVDKIPDSINVAVKFMVTECRHLKSYLVHQRNHRKIRMFRIFVVVCVAGTVVACAHN